MDALPPHKLSHEQRLDRLAEIAVRVGLRVAPGQELVINASVESLPLVRRVTEHAYKAGSSLVTSLFADEASTLLRFKYAPDESFEKSCWLDEAMGTALGNGAAWLMITGDDPALLAEQDPERVARADRSRWTALSHILNFDINWSIVSYATSGWAKAVFPGLTEEAAINELWNAIFTASRVDTPDPVAAWQTHKDALAARTRFLNEKRFAALHFHGPGTDLRVGLADDHEWVGGFWKAKNGIAFTPNIPCEEIATAPHKDRVEGTVRSTKPLSYQGALIEGITARLARGRIIDADADKGRDLLWKLLETDEGARRLGEVALVPESSPIARSGLLFYNILYDENAACHLAFGQSYNICLINGSSLSAAELDAKGANRSLIHIDWMIGSPNINVDGITGTNVAVPLMRAGEWAFPLS